MFILSCGRGSVGAAEFERDGLHERSESTEQRAGSESQLVDAAPASMLRREVTLSNYDSMSTRLKTASRSNFPSLWSTAASTTSSRPSDVLTTPSTSDLDELPIPELHVGQYKFFCQPQTWSPVFASPGEFTLRVDSVSEKNGEILVQIAVVCSSVQAIKDAPPSASTGSTKRKSFVQYVDRSHSELVKFCETMALKYLGHRLMEKLPRLGPSILSTPQKELDKYGVAVTQFLSGLLSIGDVGYNRLVTLQEPVVKNLIVRDFFNLSLGFGDPGMLSTSSCDARLERRTNEQLALPSAWFDVLDTAQSKSFSVLRPGESPRMAIPLRALSSRLSDSGYDFKPSQARVFTPTAAARSSGITGTSAAWGMSNCTRFIKPSRWHHAKDTEGAFTVEITGITISEGRAMYTICVLYCARNKIEMKTIDRRFSEFDTLVNRVERKLRALPVRNHFPTKTLFRYLSASYLERRAAYLQRFLEKLLQMRFLGVLDQEISMVAEPNVREFLKLPSVEWSITPWAASTTAKSHDSTVHDDAGARNRDQSRCSNSPSVAGESLYSATSYSSGVGFGIYETEPSTPKYYSFNHRRTGSM